MFGAMFLLIVIGMPIAFGMGFATLACLWYYSAVPLIVLPQRVVVNLDSYFMLAIPLFILAGYLMETGGISERIIRLASALVGFLRGGLAQVVIVATVIFSGLSGSSVADTAAIGSVMIPTMVRRGYPRAFSTALVASAGGMGILIPPCITMIIYGLLSDTSVGQLFLAGFLPGFLMAGGMMLITYVLARRRKFPVERQFSLTELYQAARGAALPLLMPIIIMGGILGGIFTVTESAAVAVFYGFFLSVVVYREIRLRELPTIFVKTAVTTGVVTVLLALSGAFAWVLGRERIPQQIAEFIGGMSSSPLFFLAMVNVLLLIAGCVMDGAAILILFVPILVPIAVNLGVDLVHFGIVVTANIGIGMITPPVGITLFTACGIGEVSISEVTKPLLPFIAMLMATLLLITYWPGFTLLLPRLFFK